MADNSGVSFEGLDFGSLLLSGVELLPAGAIFRNNWRFFGPTRELIANVRRCGAQCFALFCFGFASQLA